MALHWQGQSKILLEGVCCQASSIVACCQQEASEIDTTHEAIASQDVLQISSNQLGRLDQFFHKHNKLRLFEPNIKEKITKAEIKIVAGLEVTIKLLHLQVDKSGRSKECMF
jgi:hypothetical protein